MIVTIGYIPKQHGHVTHPNTCKWCSLGYSGIGQNCATRISFTTESLEALLLVAREAKEWISASAYIARRVTLRLTHIEGVPLLEAGHDTSIQ